MGVHLPAGDPPRSTVLNNLTQNFVLIVFPPLGLVCESVCGLKSLWVFCFYSPSLVIKFDCSSS